MVLMWGGHVIRPFQRMLVIAILRRDILQKGQQVLLHGRVEILLNGQGGGCVLAEERQGAGQGPCFFQPNERYWR